MKIKTSKYNEVAPSEIKRLIEAGAEIVHRDYVSYTGVVIDKINGELITTVDNIRIHNIELPLALGADEYFSSWVEINPLYD